MKMTRKFIPALVMLLVSAIMLSTASFAWFASNTNVTATDMSVTAKANTKFLHISNAEEGTFDITAKATNTAADVDLIHAAIDANKKDVAWGYGTSTSISDANVGSALKDVDAGDIAGKYALVNDFWVKMSDESSSGLVNLTVTSITVTGTSKLSPALRVLVVGEDGAQLYKDNGGTWVSADANSATALVNTLDAKTDIAPATKHKVSVYVFYDGADASAKTENTLSEGDLAAMTVSVQFSASEPTV